MASQISKRFVESTCSPLFIRQVALYDSVSARATLCATWSLVARVFRSSGFRSKCEGFRSKLRVVGGLPLSLSCLWMHSKCRQEARHASSRQLHELLTPKDCNTICLRGALGSERTAIANPLFARRGASDGSASLRPLLTLGCGRTHQIWELKVSIVAASSSSCRFKLGHACTLREFGISGPLPVQAHPLKRHYVGLIVRGVAGVNCRAGFIGCFSNNNQDGIKEV